jgi:hypothetical protein
VRRGAGAGRPLAHGWVAGDVEGVAAAAGDVEGAAAAAGDVKGAAAAAGDVDGVVDIADTEGSGLAEKRTGQLGRAAIRTPGLLRIRV